MDILQPFTVGDAARLLGARALGPLDMPITGINEIHKVRPGDLTFSDVAKYFKKALDSAATIIMLNQEVPVPEGKAVLVSEQPFHDYNKLVAHFHPAEQPYLHGQAPEQYIHPSAVIYPGVYLGRNVRIGEGCIIYPNVVIYDNVILGNHVTVHANTVLGSHAYYYKGWPTHYEKWISCGRVVIGDHVEIGAACTIDKGVSGDTFIGEGTKLDNQVHIGHDVEIGRKCLLGAQVGIAGTTIIEDNVIVWGQAGITKDVRIGKGAVISAQSGVSKSLEGGKAYFGSPAQEIRKIQKEMAWLRREANKE